MLISVITTAAPIQFRNDKRKWNGSDKIPNKIESNRNKATEFLAVGIFCAIECLVIGLFERVNKWIDKSNAKYVIQATMSFILFYFFLQMQQGHNV